MNAPDFRCRSALSELPGFQLRSAAAFLFFAFVLSLTGCLGSAGVGPNAELPLETVPTVDLGRFAGKWFVVESIGTGAEEGAHDAIEIYRLREDGRIDIDFRFKKGSFDGPTESIPQLGWVHNEATPGEWRVRPIWPLSLAYLILELGPDYEYTVVGHPSKRWVWVLSRKPSLENATLEAIRGRLAAVGYDVDLMRSVPQSPLNERDDS
jgi:apolipoprotein D and lipocalin family protein